MSTTDTTCPACGADPGRTVAQATTRAVPAWHVTVDPAPASDGQRVAVPGRIAAGTLIQRGAVRQELVMGRRDVWSHRIAAVAGLLALAGVLAARGPSLAALLVVAVGLLVIAALGVVLRAAMPKSTRYLVTAGTVSAALWPWTLPLRLLDAGRSVDVLPLLVKDLEGVEHRCEVRGELAPGSLGQGAQVEVYGRRQRDGSVRVRQLVDGASGREVRPKTGLAAGVTRAASAAVTFVLAAAAVCFLWLLAFS